MQAVQSYDSRKTRFVQEYKWRTGKVVLVKSRLTKAVERAKAAGRSYVVGYKKCYVDDGTYNTFEDRRNLWTRKRCIVKLHIPVKAQRRQPTNYKCRASRATVVGIFEYLRVEDKVKLTKINAVGQPYNKPRTTVRYKVGNVVRPEQPFGKLNEECASGIHFFLSAKEASEW